MVLHRTHFTRKLKEAVLLFGISFLINFFWESVHAVLFYEGLKDYLAIDFVKLISYASFVDALCITSIFIIGCVLFRKVWLNPYNSKQAIFTAVAGLFIAIFIETRALLANRWSYTSFMPVIFGLGVSPLIQLSITGILSIFLVSRIR